MLVNDRTHPLHQDLDWVPSAIKRWRWLARLPYYEEKEDLSPAVIPLMLIPGIDALVTLYAWIGKDRSANYDSRWLQDRLHKFGARECSLANLDAASVGERVLVRGRVARADAPVRGVLEDREGVCRRLAFHVDFMWWIHEAAVDFSLVGESGESVPVHAAGARLISRLGEPALWPARHFVEDTAPHGVRARYSAGRVMEVRAAEYVLEADEQVRTIGHRTSVPDPTGTSSGYREPPLRAALAGNADLPLLIVRMAT